MNAIEKSFFNRMIGDISLKLMQKSSEIKIFRLELGKGFWPWLWFCVEIATTEFRFKSGEIVLGSNITLDHNTIAFGLGFGLKLWPTGISSLEIRQLYFPICFQILRKNQTHDS
jgi:hypothetical protein